MSSDAIFGLLGVLAGGGITFGIERSHERSRQRDETRVAMRMMQAELSLRKTLFTADEPTRQRLAEQPAWAAARNSEAWMAYRTVLLRELSAWETAKLIEHYASVGGDHDLEAKASQLAVNEEALLITTRWIAHDTRARLPQKPHMFERPGGG